MKAESEPTPIPRTWQFLVTLLLWGSRREVVLGDLEEALLERLERGEATNEARRHYRSEAMSSVWALYRSGTVFRSELPDSRATFAPTPQTIWNTRRTRQGDHTMQTLWNEVRFAAKALLRRPGFSLTVLSAVALGIGASTLVFSVVEAALLRSLPVKDPDSLVMVWNRQAAEGGGSNLLSPADYDELRRRTNTLETVGAFGEIVVAPVVGTETPAFAKMVTVSSSFFEMLGLRAQRGRLFEVADGTPRPPETPAPPSQPMVISDAFWQRELGGDPDVVGTTLQVFSGNFQIVGVLPPGFRLVLPAAADVGEDLGTSIDLWTVWAFDMSQASRSSRWFRVVGRRADEYTLADVRGELQTVATEMRTEFDELEESGFDLGAQGFVEESAAHIRPLLAVLSGAVLCVLLVACVNASSLLLARTSERGRELSVRAAMGADRWRLARLSIAESVVLALAGGVLGTGLAALGMKALAVVRPAGLPQASELSLNLDVLGFALGVVLVSALIAGLLPALRAMRHGQQDQLTSRSSTPGRGQRRLRDALVVVQITLTVTLLLATGLLLRSLAELQRVPLGFEPANVLTVDISTVGEGYDRSEPDFLVAVAPWLERRRVAERALSEKLLQMPGVEGAGAVFPVPLNGTYSRTCDYSLTPEGRPEVSGVAYFRNIWPGYFDSMGIPLLAGRDLRYSDDVSGVHEWADEDTVRTDRPTVVIDSRLAAALWPGESAIGKTLRHRNSGDTFHDAEVVGVVPFVAQGGVMDHRPTIYIPRSYYRSQELTLTVRVHDDTPAMREAIIAAVRSEFPQSPAQIKPLDEYVAKATETNRFVLGLLGAFAGVALLLAGIGIYGALALTVRQRTTEIGVHLAMGASPSTVFRGVVSQSMTLAAAGIAVGVTLAIGGSGLLASYLYEVSGSDPVALAATVAIQCLVTLLACWIPARRAAGVEPMAALRAE